MAGTAAQASAEEVAELMADDRSIPPTCSPYAGELLARDKIADVYTPGYLQATERHFGFRYRGWYYAFLPVQQFSTRAAEGQQRN